MTVKLTVKRATLKRGPGARVRIARLTAWMTLIAATACADFRADESDCELDVPLVRLPSELRETSGVTAGLRNPSLIWTHNDQGNGPVLYAVDRDGRIHARVEVNESNRDDWEDIARGRCELGACLYIAGTGDNTERRDVISFYRLAEPEGEGERTVDAERYRMVLPDGPRDIEAMYVLPTDQVFLVTKGRNHPVTVYRYPLPLRSESVVTLTEVQRLTDGPVALPRMVTGASATLDGGTVVIRTYQSLEFFQVTDGGVLVPSGEGPVNLVPLGEAQGEGVGFGTDGRIILSSEGAGFWGPTFAFLGLQSELSCTPN